MAGGFHKKSVEIVGKICYNNIMQDRRKIIDFIEKRKHFFWYVPESELKNLKDESIVEHTLNYGDWDDVQKLISILGMERTAEIFRRKSKKSEIGRTNYRPEIINYFNLYFDKYASGNSHKKAERAVAARR